MPCKENYKPCTVCGNIWMLFTHVYKSYSHSSDFPRLFLRHFEGLPSFTPGVNSIRILANLFLPIIVNDQHFLSRTLSPIDHSAFFWPGEFFNIIVRWRRSERCKKKWIAWLSLNFILDTSWVALSSVVCEWVSMSGIGNIRPNLHFFQYIQAYKPFADPVPPT